MGLLGLVFGLFQTSYKFLSQSDFSKKARIVQTVNSRMHQLRSGKSQAPVENWTEGGVHYFSEVDSSFQDSITFEVKALSPHNARVLYRQYLIQLR